MANNKTEKTQDKINSVMNETINTLKTDRDRFVAFAFASADILLELDPGGKILYADGATSGLLGRNIDELTGYDFYTIVYGDDTEKARNALDELSSKQRLDNIELRLASKHNDAMPFALSGFRLSNLKNHTYLSLSILKGDVSADQLFKRDYDSGLLKKNSFIETANEKIHEAHASGETLNMTLLDLPELKQLLDTLSPEAAEQLLAEISQYLRDTSVGGDTAGIIGEDSFTFVHDEKTDPAEVINSIIDITKKVDPKGKGLDVRTETITADPGRLSSVDSANALLYTLNNFAEKKGENFTIESLADSYEGMLENTVEKIAHFKNTVDEEAFQLAFQPIVDLKNGIIHHFETLVRVNDNSVFKNPFEFISFGEQAGVIGDFDLLMCQKTFDVLADASVKGNKPTISVNLSGKSLSSTLFKDALLEMLNNHEKVRKQVIFEITESARIPDLSSANAFVQELRQAGNLCCLDDFGTGESSFEYLRNLQVDFIKIDGSYVRESLQTQRGRHMLKAMAGLCRDLNVVTIGEMVEDEKSAAFLWEAGVKFGQGYLFGKPTVDVETLVHCKKPTPFYHGMMRARRVDQKQRAWWAAKD